VSSGRNTKPRSALSIERVGRQPMPLTFQLEQPSYLKPQKICHFDRPTEVEKPQHFADVCITKKSNGTNRPTASFTLESKWHYAAAPFSVRLQRYLGIDVSSPVCSAAQRLIPDRRFSIL
jgi:hypothetical protein